MSAGLKGGEVTNRKTERSYPLQTYKIACAYREICE